MIVWMAWATLVTLTLGLAALAAERVLLGHGRPTRWVWVGALAASVALQLWSALGPASPSTPTAVSPSTGGIDPAWLAALASLERMGPSSTVSAALTRFDGLVTAAWVAGALGLTVAMVGGLLLLGRRASRWRSALVAGERVLVSEGFGPALVGLLSPTIVIPSWATGRPAEELRLIVRHEVEHRQAGDTWILLGASLASAVLFWNVALCWLAHRLRSAVEVDCDARVLRAVPTPHLYGSLLLDIGSRQVDSGSPVLALARPASLLERRLRMIVHDVRKRSPVGSAVLTALAAALVFVACEAPAPTGFAPEIQPDIVSSVAEAVEPPGGALRLASERIDAQIFIDGEEVDELPPGLHADDIERIDVFGGLKEAGPRVEIFLKAGREESSGAYVFLDDEPYAGRVSSIPTESIDRVEVVKGPLGDSIFITSKRHR